MVKVTVRKQKYLGAAGLVNRGVLAINIRAEIHMVSMIKEEDIRSLNINLEKAVMV